MRIGTLICHVKGLDSHLLMEVDLISRMTYQARLISQPLRNERIAFPKEAKLCC